MEPTSGTTGAAGFLPRPHAAWLRASLPASALALVVVMVLFGCSRKQQSILVPNLPPTIELSAAPLPGDSVFYVVRFNWFSFDPDGEVSRFEYVVDPPAGGDTAWIHTEARELTIRFRSSTPRSDAPPSGQVPSSEYHVFAIRAVDNEGLLSPVAYTAFISYTVAPTTLITYPTPSRLVTISTPPSFRFEWTGTDPDGVGSKLPAKYKFKIIPLPQVQSDLGVPPNGRPSAEQLQDYLLRDAPGFATWDSVPPDSPFVRYETLPLGITQYFAVIAVDEAGAYDPRFSLDRNVILFKPSTLLQNPKLTVSNDYFTFTATSFNLDEERVAHLPVPVGSTVHFDWEATAAVGSEITAYRWVLDPVDGDIGDETQRDRDDQYYRWSSWSLAERALTLGPFSTEQRHRFYVEARDNSNGLTIAVVEIEPIERSRDILLVDDFQGSPDRLYGPGDARNYQPYGNFPTEAVLDTLLVAHGGVPYKFRPLGTLSDPGMFAGYNVDTLDYRFARTQGIPLEVLLRYRAVVWYAGVSDAIRSSPACALRYSCQKNHQNTLAVYLNLGGKAFLFGDGAVLAIQLGTYGSDVFNLPKEPTPGTFLYDYLMLRSRFDSGGRNANGSDRMVGATSYLPENHTAGARWPLDTTKVITRGPCDDPRVGPASARNVSRWGGLPCLSITTEFADWPVTLPTSFANVMYISRSLIVIEDVGGAFESRLDTLYLYRAASYLSSPTIINADGKPVMVSYWGRDHGPVVWTTLPLWVFERTQLQAIAERVMTNFGIARNPDPSTWTGPGSAQWLLPGNEVQTSARR